MYDIEPKDSTAHCVNVLSTPLPSKYFLSYCKAIFAKKEDTRKSAMLLNSHVGFISRATHRLSHHSHSYYHGGRKQVALNRQEFPASFHGSVDYNILCDRRQKDWKERNLFQGCIVDTLQDWLYSVWPLLFRYCTVTLFTNIML